MRDLALADHAFLEGFEEEHLDTIENCVAGRSVWKQGEMMLLRGGHAGTCHLIVDGTVAIEIRSPGSVPTIFQTLQGGDVLGYRSEDLLSKAFIEFVHPDDREATLAAVNQLEFSL